jgi:hypothetical protein
MGYFLLRPEAASELGDHTVLDTSVHPPRVERLHIELSDWLGDDILWSYPAYLVSEDLARKLAASGLGVFTLADAEVSLSPEAAELLGGTAVPDFRWWQVTGRAGVDDFGVTDKAQLVVSAGGLAVLREAGRLENCETEGISLLEAGPDERVDDMPAQHDVQGEDR